MSTLPAILSRSLPALVAAAGERTSMRFLELFAANIRNPHSAGPMPRAAEEFLAWRGAAGVPSITAVQPVHVATWIEAGTRKPPAPSVKQRLAAFDPTLPRSFRFSLRSAEAASKRGFINLGDLTRPDTRRGGRHPSLTEARPRL